MADRLEMTKRLLSATMDYSLVADAANGDYTDAGANEHLNNGAAWLDDHYRKGSTISEVVTSAPLDADTDTNFWSINKPELLLQAAKLSFEGILLRNSEGVNDIFQPLIDALIAFRRRRVAERVASKKPRDLRM